MVNCLRGSHPILEVHLEKPFGQAFVTYFNIRRLGLANSEVAGMDLLPEPITVRLLVTGQRGGNEDPVILVQKS